MTIIDDTFYLRRNLKESNFQRIKRMNREELAAFLDRVELGDIEFSVTFCDLCQKNHNGECDRKGCIRTWLDVDSKDHPQGLDNWEKDNG